MFHLIFEKSPDLQEHISILLTGGQSNFCQKTVAISGL
jgi:hypothetical protein